MNDFEFTSRTRIVFGENEVENLGSIARDLGAEQALLLTDPGLVAAGHVARAIASLQAVDIEFAVHDGVTENPTSTDVAAAVHALEGAPADVIIGFGGGSSLDVAKGVNFIRAGGGRMEDYHGAGKARGDLLPMIAVPTTAGTGSEMQSFALIARDDSHEKMACGDERATPAVALLDPTLTVSQPERVTALSGLDAIGHALETAVTTRRNPESERLSEAAFARLARSFDRVLDAPNDIDARGDMLIGAAWAGLAIEKSMLGAAHAMANPLTARHGIAHGMAVALMLPVVMRFNAEDPVVANRYAVLAEDAGLKSGPESLIEWFEARVARAGIAPSLKDNGIAREDIEMLARDAVSQWTGTFNPRALDVDVLTELYEKTHV